MGEGAPWSSCRCEAVAGVTALCRERHVFVWFAPLLRDARCRGVAMVLVIAAAKIAIGYLGSGGRPADGGVGWRRAGSGRELYPLTGGEGARHPGSHLVGRRWGARV